MMSNWMIRGFEEMETKKTSNRALFVFITIVVAVGVYWSAYENESKLAKDKTYHQGDSALDESALPFIMDSFQQSEAIGEVKVAAVNEIGEPLSLDFIPEEQDGVLDVNLGETMNVNEVFQSSQPPVQLGETISVDYVPSDESGSLAINLGELLNVDEYYGNKASNGESVDLGKPLDADEFLKQQDSSPTKG